MDTDSSDWIHGAHVAWDMKRIGIDIDQVMFLARDGRLVARAEQYLVMLDPDHPESTGSIELGKGFWKNYILGRTLADGRIRSSVNWDSSSFGCLDDFGRIVKANGVCFRRSELYQSFPMIKAIAEALAAAQLSPSAIEDKSSQRAKAGTKADKLRWEQFAAAFAVLAERGELDLTSENKARDGVATFLMERGHEDALGVDTVRSLIRRYKAWLINSPFPDDIKGDLSSGAAD